MLGYYHPVIPSHNRCLPGTGSCPSRGPSFIYCHLYTATPPRPSWFCRVTSLAMACTSLIFSLLTAPLLLEGRHDPGSVGRAAGTCWWDPKPPLPSVVIRGLGRCHRGVLLDCATVWRSGALRMLWPECIYQSLTSYATKVVRTLIALTYLGLLYKGNSLLWGLTIRNLLLANSWNPSLG